MVVKSVRGMIFEETFGLRFLGTKCALLAYASTIERNPRTSGLFFTSFGVTPPGLVLKKSGRTFTVFTPGEFIDIRRSLPCSISYWIPSRGIGTVT